MSEHPLRPKQQSNQAAQLASQTWLNTSQGLFQSSGQKPAGHQPDGRLADLLNNSQSARPYQGINQPAVSTYVRPAQMQHNTASYPLQQIYSSGKMQHQQQHQQHHSQQHQQQHQQQQHQQQQQQQRQHQQASPQQQQHQLPRPQQQQQQQPRLQQQQHQQSRPSPQQHQQSRPSPQQHQQSRPSPQQHLQSRPPQQQHQQPRPHQQQHQQNYFPRSQVLNVGQPPQLRAATQQQVPYSAYRPATNSSQVPQYMSSQQRPAYTHVSQSIQTGQLQTRPNPQQPLPAPHQGQRVATGYVPPGFTPPSTSAIAQQYNAIVSTLRPGFPAPQPAPVPVLSEEDKKVLPKKSLKRKAVAAAGDSSAELDAAVEAALVQVADDFITGAVAFASGLARRRKSAKLEAADVAVYLERAWQLHVPGFSESTVKPYRRPAAKALHSARAAAIRVETAASSQAAAAAADKAQAEDEAKAAQAGLSLLP